MEWLFFVIFWAIQHGQTWEISISILPSSNGTVPSMTDLNQRKKRTGQKKKKKRNPKKPKSMCQLPQAPKPPEIPFSQAKATRVIVFFVSGCGDPLDRAGPRGPTPTYYPAGDWSGYFPNQFPGKSDKENKLDLFLISENRFKQLIWFFRL